MRPYIISKRISTQHRVRLYKTYIEPVLLYNSETWSLTSKQEESLDSFHRRLLRIVMNIRYPKIISSKKLYNITKETPLSTKIKKRRLALLGHILRLDPGTPAQKALQYYMTPHKRPAGIPPLTWVAVITKDITKTLTHHNIKKPLTKKSLEKLSVIARDNCLWRREIVRNMEDDL